MTRYGCAASDHSDLNETLRYMYRRYRPGLHDSSATPAGPADAPSTDLVGEFAERAVDVVIDVVTAAAASTAAGRRDRARRVVVQQVTTTHTKQ